MWKARRKEGPATVGQTSQWRRFEDGKTAGVPHTFFNNNDWHSSSSFKSVETRYFNFLPRTKSLYAASEKCVYAQLYGATCATPAVCAS
jgi:hypothetical protein